MTHRNPCYCTNTAVSIIAHQYASYSNNSTSCSKKHLIKVTVPTKLSTV